AVDSLGAGGERRRHVQDGRRAAPALYVQGSHARKGRDRVLPDRRAKRAHVVRPPRAARLRAGPELRRLVDGVGQPRRRADRKVKAWGGPRVPPPPPPSPPRGRGGFFGGAGGGGGFAGVFFFWAFPRGGGGFGGGGG